MPQRILKALSGRDIKQGQYILLRRMDDGQLVVNVMEIVTEPVLNESQGVKVFQAKGLFVGDRALSDEEGAPIELDFNDIGTPWKGSLEGFNCRTFTYGELEHFMLVKDVERRSTFWCSMLHKSACTIHYTVEEQKPAPAFPVDHLSASTALSSFKIRRA